MIKRKGIRLLAALALCFTLCISFTVPAFAYADDTEQELPVTEATQPEATPETAAPEEPEPYEGEPIDGEGNAYTRDLLYDKATNKQFITVQTKTGNTFYVVIDYDAPINEEEEQYQTYFLNMVDEADLLALMDEEEAAKYQEKKPEVTEPAETEKPKETEPAPEKQKTESEQKKASPLPMIMLLLFVIGAAGVGGYLYVKMKGVRPASKKNQPDPDADYHDEDEDALQLQEEDGDEDEEVDVNEDYEAESDDEPV